MAPFPVVVEAAELDDAPAVADVFLKAFNSDFFQAMFPQNEHGRDYMTKACEQFLLSKQNGSQEGRVFVVRNEKGEPVAASLVWIVRPEDNGTWSWRKRWPPANAGQRDELLNEFFAGMATQHHRIMGTEPHVYFELIMTDPAYRRRGYGLALLRRASEIADELSYPMYLDAEEYIVQLYELAGYVAKTDLGQTSTMVPMVRPVNA